MAGDPDFRYHAEKLLSMLGSIRFEYEQATKDREANDTRWMHLYASEQVMRMAFRDLYGHEMDEESPHEFLHHPGGQAGCKCGWKSTYGWTSIERRLRFEAHRDGKPGAFTMEDPE